MGCRSDYMEPTDREKYVQKTAQNLVYVLKSLKQDVPKNIVETSENIYAQDSEDLLTPKLCDLLKKMNKRHQNSIIFNGRSKESRQLAEWWEEHQELDKNRIKQEKEDKKKLKLKKQALAKLSQSEKKALGL